MKKKSSESRRPNILLIMADEYRFPQYFGTEFGMAEPIKNILGFQGGAANIADYAKYFPGLVRLRENAVVLRKHTIAASACVPSRAVMFTGQYGARTGVTQTDGVFKSGDANNYPWLQPDGIPTMGDWFRAAGYKTHYFGKCHFVDPPDHSLEKFGFDDWEHSYPEPHGSSVNNLGIYRDHGFTDLVTTFLRSKGLALGYDRAVAESEVVDPDPMSKLIGQQGRRDKREVRQAEDQPWFAVASFTNPHDITTYPMLPRDMDPGADQLKPPKIPKRGSRSAPPEAGTWQVPLNSTGFPQNNANLPPTWKERLDTNNKPDCQYDYSLKLGMALASKGGKLPGIMAAPKAVGLPLPLSDNPKNWSTRYLQYYTYLHYALDQHINQVLETLDETGLRKDTIVVFAPDHGDYGASHGMLQQKWHTAYQEAVHVPVVISSPKIHPSKKPIRQIEALTSHIDLIPTLLGLAGIDNRRRAKIADKLRVDHDVPNLVGVDLSGVVTGKKAKIPDREAEGILFVTDDMITEPLPYIDDPHDAENREHFELYCQAVEKFTKKWPLSSPPPTPGPVCQPCHVQCVRQADWKLSRYFDPNDESVENQWELYDLSTDPYEQTNLLVCKGKEFPTAIPKKSFPGSLKLTREEVENRAKELHERLQHLTERMLSRGNYPTKTTKGA